MRRHFTLGCTQFVEEIRANRQQITTRQPEDLIHFSKTRTHYLSFVIELLKIVVNPGDGRYAGIFIDRNISAAPFFFVPVIDSTYKRRNKRDASFCAGHRLGKAEQER